MKKHILTISVLSILANFIGINDVYANLGDSRNIPGVNIISRKDRGADDTRLLQTRLEYQEILKNRQLSAEKNRQIMEDLKINNPTKYNATLAQQKINADKAKAANNYMTTNHSNELKIDKVVKSIGSVDYRRPLQYKQDKNRIIIHHTVNDVSKVNSVDDVKEILKGIYKFHAFNRGRGDIGYNFLIDQFGNIYEGRSGGEGVIGAHASMNNPASIGISLIGNFDVQELPKEQLNALINLITGLSKKYGINPTSRVVYHKESDIFPYIKDIQDETIIGHRDCGATSCPGKNVYDKIPYIQQEIMKKIGSSLLSFQNGDKIIYHPNNIFSNTKEIQIAGIINFDIPNKLCTISDNNVEIKECIIENGVYKIKLNQTKNGSSGRKIITLGTSGSQKIQIEANIFWMADFELLLNTKRNQYITNKSVNMKPKAEMKKINQTINKDQIKDIVNKPINVLLYEASSNLSGRNIECTYACTLKIDDKEYKNISDFQIKEKGESIIIDINDTIFTAKKLSITPQNGSEIIIKNYNRKSYAGIPRNSFVGELIFEYSNIKQLNGTIKNKFIVINRVNLDQYLEGIIESNDQEPIEKQKTMALLSKNYVLFYQKNIHPYILDGASYNAIDDARIFQKYVGNGAKKTIKSWTIAVSATKDQYVLYDGILALLPYYTCSAGFTRSAKEKRGRTDTPYLQSRLDFDQCTSGDFDGHGVGLSGRGATYMAKNNLKMQDIIQYYFGGVSIETVK